jgi:phosphoesterase RecJ-like protein
LKPIQELYSLLKTPRRVAITTHEKPDADAMGSSLALRHFLTQLGHSVTVISPTNWAGWVDWMPGTASVLDYERQKDLADRELEAADWLFCLDFNTVSRTRSLAPKLRSIACTRILIDHHREPDTEFFDFGISDTGKSSTCEMIYDLITGSGYGDRIDVAVSECLYAGVVGDTGSFRFPSTHEGVHRLVADLKSRGLVHHIVHEQLFDTYKENRLRFIGHVLLHRMEVLYEYQTVLIAIPRSDLIRYEIRTGDTEGLVNYPQMIQGIKLVALVIDRDVERKWSFRSKGAFDCNQFARSFFEGGGHFNAAGGRSSDSLESTVARFKQVLKDQATLLQ